METTIKEADLVLDIHNSPEFIALLGDTEFCREFWTAFANVTWFKKFEPKDSDGQQVIDVLAHDQNDGERQWGASFRGMGRVIADLRNEYHGTSEDYMDWYCSNITSDGLTWDHNPTARSNYCYGYVTSRVRAALHALGWYPVVNKDYLEANP